MGLHRFLMTTAGWERLRVTAGRGPAAFSLSSPRGGGRRGCGQAQWLSGQAALAKEVALAMERHDRLLAPRGSDTDLDLAFLDVKDGIRQVPLRENLLIIGEFRHTPAAVSRAEELFDVERRGLSRSAGHDAPAV
jgi:hypothetical protein